MKGDGGKRQRERERRGKRRGKVNRAKEGGENGEKGEGRGKERLIKETNFTSFSDKDRWSAQRYRTHARRRLIMSVGVRLSDIDKCERDARSYRESQSMR